ncbi:MFS transporter [Streptomyces sp. NPDC001941]|uniref:MFS transporter n=1 Tax=Streptomyces sp. NPDC001941 TaxID=3154659 RepID=UPI00332D9FCA
MSLNMRELRRFPPQIWIVSVATLVNRCVGFLGLFAAVFFQGMRATSGTVAFALLAVGAAGIVGSIVGGRAAERLGSLPVLVAGCFVNVPLLFCLSFLTDSPYASIPVAAVSVAISQSFVGPSAALVSSSSYEGPTVTAFAFYRIFLNVGMVAAPAVAGIVGFSQFPLLFRMSAVGSLLAGVLLVAERKSMSPRASGAEAGQAAAAAPEPPVEDPVAARHKKVRLWSVIVAFGVTIAVYAQHQSGIPLSLDRLDGGDRLYAVLLLINPVVIIVAELPLSTLTAKFNWGKAFAAGSLLTCVGLAVCGLSSAWAVCIIGFVVFSLGEAVFAPLGNSSVAELAGPAENARYQGYLSAAQSTGIALGPAVGAWGVLHDRVVFWIATAVVGLALAALLVATGKERVVARERVEAAV